MELQEISIYLSLQLQIQMRGKVWMSWEGVGKFCIAAVQIFNDSMMSYYAATYM